jgi:hypothetical protein
MVQNQHTVLSVLLNNSNFYMPREDVPEMP